MHARVSMPGLAGAGAKRGTHLVDGNLGGYRHRLGSWQLGVQHAVEVVSRRPVHERAKRACSIRASICPP